MTFGNWNESIHDDYEQIKRIAFMQRIKSENVSASFTDATAKIIGSEGTYDVTLNNCSCHDFSMRRLPCKHIYRLALELGLLNDLPKIDKKAAKLFKNEIPIEIERYKKLYLSGAISIEKLNKIINALQSK